MGMGDVRSGAGRMSGTMGRDSESEAGLHGTPTHTRVPLKRDVMPNRWPAMSIERLIARAALSEVGNEGMPIVIPAPRDFARNHPISPPDNHSGGYLSSNRA